VTNAVSISGHDSGPEYIEIHVDSTSRYDDIKSKFGFITPEEAEKMSKKKLASTKA
jgi:hypothetical protein